MTQESVVQQVLARFDRLPADEALVLEALAVHQWFSADIAAYTAANLGLGLTAEQVTASPFVVADRVPPAGPGSEPQYGIRSALRTALNERMRSRRPTAYRHAHRIAATYYTQPLHPLRTDRLTWYVYEVRHLAAFRPELATARLAAFAHDALVAGCAEAAGRAAAEVAAVSPRPGDQSLAGIIESVAAILNAPSQVEHATVVALDGLVARSGTPSDPATTRLVSLARDLVVYYTERPAPVVPLTAQVVPSAAAVIDPRGMPVLGGDLRLLEDLAQPSRIITSRTHRVELKSSTAALHQVTTRLATEDRSGRSVILVDLLPRSSGDRLDALRLSDRGGRGVIVLGAGEMVRVLAQGLGRLLNTGEPPGGGSTRAELSRRLDALGWDSGTDGLAALVSRTQQADDVEDFLRERFDDLMHYTPVVALLDVHPGWTSEVTYGDQRESTTRRDGWGRVVVSLTVTVPVAVRNRLEFVTPDGLEPADVRAAEDVGLVRVGNERTSSTLQQFDVDRASGDGEDESVARIEVDLGYRLPDREFKGVQRTALLCMALSALALLLLFANIALVAAMATVLTAVGVVADMQRDGPHHDNDEPLHVYAGKRLRLVRRTDAAAAIAAVTVPNSGSTGISLVTSGIAFVYCFATYLLVLSAKRASHRPLAPMDPSTRHRTPVG
ncbi:hypothetical protein [Streptomyces sp. SID3212]|uniref:hypothetical protein n=1 Tax=Streptomyces sp. SID3212 TaxID=2690259 RepID=UPI001370723F|nr:hypothetical protein [Streptomyces sp. SID3212]MYV51695.1 hypothetical protein [Streptomyces sp. SID3212]